jgi:hypothetical protein
MENKIELIPTETQKKVFLSTADTVFFGGAVSGGKSWLLRAYMITLCTRIRNIQCTILRKYSNELIQNHMLGPSGFYSMLTPYINSGFVKITNSPPTVSFANGAKIHLSYCEHSRDRFKFQGMEVHCLGIDEGSTMHYDIYQYIRSRLRMPDDKSMLEDIKQLNNSGIPFNPCKTIFCTNPGGLSAAEIKRDFIDVLIPNKLTNMPDRLGGGTAIYIPSRMDDNPHIDTEKYKKKIMGLGGAMAKAYIEGNWNCLISEGAFFGDTWDESIHVIEPFIIPTSWYIDRCFDYGSSAPSCCLWVAESNGEEVTLNNNTILHTIPGDIFIFCEYVTHDKTDISKGNKMLAKDIAININKIDKIFEKRGYKIKPGPADNSIYTNVNDNCIADDMKTQGVKWTKSDKSPGSRVNGLEIMRTYLDNAKTKDGKGLYFFNTCKYCLATIPILPRDMKKIDDIDTTSNDHALDPIRYRLLTKKHKTINSSNLIGLI